MEGGRWKEFGGGLTFMDEVPHHLRYRVLRVVPSSAAYVRAFNQPR